MWKNTRIGDWVTFTGDAAKQFGKFKSTTAGLVSNIDESLVPPLATVILPAHLALMHGMGQKKYKELMVPLNNTRIYTEDVKVVEKALMKVICPEEEEEVDEEENNFGVFDEEVPEEITLQVAAPSRKRKTEDIKEEPASKQAKKGPKQELIEAKKESKAVQKIAEEAKKEAMAAQKAAEEAKRETGDTKKAAKAPQKEAKDAKKDTKKEAKQTKKEEVQDVDMGIEDTKTGAKEAKKEVQDVDMVVEDTKNEAIDEKDAAKDADMDVKDAKKETRGAKKAEKEEKEAREAQKAEKDAKKEARRASKANTTNNVDIDVKETKREAKEAKNEVPEAKEETKLHDVSSPKAAQENIEDLPKKEELEVPTETLEEKPKKTSSSNAGPVADTKVAKSDDGIQGEEKSVPAPASVTPSTEIAVDDAPSEPKTSTPSAPSEAPTKETKKASAPSEAPAKEAKKASAPSEALAAQETPAAQAPAKKAPAAQELPAAPAAPAVSSSTLAKMAPAGVWGFFRQRNAALMKHTIKYERCLVGGALDANRFNHIKVKAEDVNKRLQEKWMEECTREFYTGLLAASNRMREKFLAALDDGNPQCWGGMNSCVKGWIMSAADVSEDQIKELNRTDWLHSNGNLIFFPKFKR